MLYYSGVQMSSQRGRSEAHFCAILRVTSQKKAMSQESLQHFIRSTIIQNQCHETQWCKCCSSAAAEAAKRNFSVHSFIHQHLSWSPASWAQVHGFAQEELKCKPTFLSAVLVCSQVTPHRKSKWTTGYSASTVIFSRALLSEPST